MTSFSDFCASLDCPLRNVRWSWSAISKSGRRAVFTIWDDQLHSDRYPLWPPSDHHINDRPGAREIRRIAEAILNSRGDSIGIRCFAQDNKAEPRKRERFDSETLLTLRVAREGEGLVAFVTGTINANTARSHSTLARSSAKASETSVPHRAFLITWRPAAETKEYGWPDKELYALVRRFSITGSAMEPWSFGAVRQAVSGDRVFVLQQGRRGHAIFGYGYIERILVDRREAIVRFEGLVDPYQQVYATQNELHRLTPVRKVWGNQKSGTELTTEVASKLEALVVGRVPQPAPIQGRVWSVAEVAATVGSVLFVRTGRMTFYRGKQPGDERPVGGGSYNKTSIGHEQFNFLDVSGMLYGYFQPQMKAGSVNLRRVTGNDDEPIANDVSVIWVAGGVIVGWYNKATLYTDPREPKALARTLRNRFKYYCSAPTSRCVLLPSPNRNFHIPQGTKGGMGRTNIRYIRDVKGRVRLQPWMAQALRWIKNYGGDSLLTKTIADAEYEMENEFFRTIPRGAGQGVGGTPQQRKAVEEWAEYRASERYRKQGYQLEKYGKPYDFLCTKGKETLYLEVKGTRSVGESIFLTAGEVKHAQKNVRRMVLCIVHSIKLSGTKNKPRASGGTVRIIHEWKPEKRALKALAYSYSLPKNKQ